ncbi:NPCC-domain-containing protein [Annulohypoxylon maeteangense]|uniref:NPCC-domain-containing protein n=1 Tax=Annulohypoxylon maeteangense TaxID=1927788 RepID=UPI0020079727|nr:NPCC-domain-containing protein [Annulohypoxylon maeteangense]KAI0883164.1 NPCC-domain-containing protein [Annulohypoxylon maeteangense]
MSFTTAKTAIITPKKSTPATPPVTDSPGTWRHPRLPEIIRRQDATNFTEKNVKRIIINVVVFIAIIFTHTMLSRMLSKKWFSYLVWYYSRYAYLAALSIPIFNVGTNLLPLFRRKDDFSDIPLTPGQRRLLGLPPTNAPPTPGSAYSTPPRYARTPSISGSAGSRRSFSGSPASNNGSPTRGSLNGSGPFGGSGGLGGLASPNSPLLQKAMNGARRSSIGSLGSGSPLGVSILGASTGSFYGGAPDSPSPASGGKRSTVGLNSKWLYERGRDRRSSSGNAWLYT